MFIDLTIRNMQPSMVYLYKVVSEKRGVTLPAAVGRVMNVSQQRLKNWETRGISKEGALLAQSKFGIDSNTLLAMNTAPIDAPMVYTEDKDTSAVVSLIEEKRATKQPTDWPFERITIDQWQRFTPKQRAAVEAVAEGYIATGDPPLYKTQPAYKIASN